MLTAWNPLQGPRLVLKLVARAGVGTSYAFSELGSRPVSFVWSHVAASVRPYLKSKPTTVALAPFSIEGSAHLLCGAATCRTVLQRAVPRHSVCCTVSITYLHDVRQLIALGVGSCTVVMLQHAVTAVQFVAAWCTAWQRVVYDQGQRAHQEATSPAYWCRSARLIVMP
jgi:hypothetical protein